jgi:hypothetical protein
MASVKAKPKIATLNKSCLNEGFLEIPRIKEPKTVPIPAPAPAKPIVAKPPPIFLAASKSILNMRALYPPRSMVGPRARALVRVKFGLALQAERIGKLRSSEAAKLCSATSAALAEQRADPKPQPNELSFIALFSFGFATKRNIGRSRKKG